jgi:hypothetical protein
MQIIELYLIILYGLTSGWSKNVEVRHVGRPQSFEILHRMQGHEDAYPAMLVQKIGFLSLDVPNILPHLLVQLAVVFLERVTAANHRPVAAFNEIDNRLDGVPGPNFEPKE